MRTDEESFLVYVQAQAAYTLFMIIFGYIGTNVAIASSTGASALVFAVGHFFITPLFSLPLVLWASLAYYANISFLWNFLMRFWTFWSIWGVTFIYFWSTFFEDWLMLQLLYDFKQVWAAYPRLRWFFYTKWLVYLGNLGLTFLYVPGYLRYLKYRQDNPTVDEKAERHENAASEDDIDSIEDQIIAF